MSNNNTKFDDEDAGIFMKQESVFDITPLTPTQNGSKSLLTPEPPKQAISVHMKRNESYGSLENRAEAKVLVLYTGGTIGMLRNDKNGKESIIKLSLNYLVTL